MMTKQCDAKLDFVVTRKYTLPSPTLRCQRLFSGCHFGSPLVPGAFVGGAGRKYGAS